MTGIATQGKMDYFISAWTTNYVVWGSVDLNNWFQAFNGKVKFNERNQNTWAKSDMARARIKRVPYTFFVKRDWDYFFLVKRDLGFFIYS